MTETVVAAADKIVLEWGPRAYIDVFMLWLPLIYGGAKKQKERRNFMAYPSYVISKKMITDSIAIYKGDIFAVFEIVLAR